MCKCRRFQAVHQLGVPTIVRGLQRGCDWDPQCLMRVCNIKYLGQRQKDNPERRLQVWRCRPEWSQDLTQLLLIEKLGHACMSIKGNTGFPFHCEHAATCGLNFL